MENTQLFYLVGFQRSGTTMACHLLDKHPEVVCCEEPETTKRIVFRQFDLLADAEFDSVRKLLDYYSVEASADKQLVGKYVRGEMQPDVFLKSCYSLFNKKGAKCVGAKEVFDLTSRRFDYAKRLMSFHGENAKFVYLERDIRGVVCSFMKLGLFPPGKRTPNRTNLRRFTRQYIECLNDSDNAL